MNSVENFNKFWEKVKKKSEELEIGQPVLPRKRKMPARYRDEQNGPDFPQTPKEHYHKIYQKAIENSENCLEERFNQKGFEMYVQIQNLLLFAADKQDYEQELKQVLDFYKDDFDEDGLRLQLKIVSANFPKKEKLVFSEIIEYFKKMDPGLSSIMSEVRKVMELILVLPATTASAERSFSRMKLIKTPLRSRMSQERLNHFMLIGLNPDLVDEIDSTKIAKEFVDRCFLFSGGGGNSRTIA